MRIFANKKFKRFVIILITVIMLFNVIAPQPIVPQAEAVSVGGILMSPLTALASGLAWAFQQVLNGVLYISTALTSGALPETQDAGDVFITDIVYNKLSIIDANIFDPANENPLINGKGDDEGISGVIKQWYGITRMMAIAASLVILVYVAIKIIIASTGKDKAKYTELLKDWLLSLLLIFTLHYVMAAILFMSDTIVGFFLNVSESGQSIFSYKSIQDQAFAFNDFSIVYALVWIALLIYTFIFLILYIKRLILICFFVVIAPLIVILSTINKLRGKGSGILDYWLKQFIANVVMQPIDALLFTIIASSIVICIESGQPLIALAFVIAFFPMRTWITQFFDQKADQNSQQDATKFVASGANMFSQKMQGVANAPKKPTFNTSNISGAIAGAKLSGGAGAAGARAGTGGGTGAGAGVGSNVPKAGWQGGYAELSPEQYQNAIDAMEAIDTNQNGIQPDASSFSSAQLGAGTSGASAISSKPSHSLGAVLENNHPRGKRAAGILGRAAKVGLSKGTGMLVGTTIGGLNAIAGNDFWKNYSPASEAAQKLTGGAIDKGAKKASQYANTLAQDGVSATGHKIKEDVSSAINQSIVEPIMDSYIATGQEGITSDKVALGQFFADGEVDDMIHELIQDTGEGNPLYEQYMSASGTGNKRAIAQQFFMESAIKDYGNDKFENLSSRKGEMKAMLGVMQRHKKSLAGKNTGKKKEEIKQRNVHYKN